MMSPTQFRLTKLAEECSEVAKAALKYSIFGGATVYEGAANETNLRNELIDVIIVYRLLVGMGAIQHISDIDVRSQYAAKHPKITERTKQLIALGTVHPDLLNFNPWELP